MTFNEKLTMKSCVCIFKLHIEQILKSFIYWHVLDSSDIALECCVVKQTTLCMNHRERGYGKVRGILKS